jgi:hypothetical protein
MMYYQVLRDVQFFRTLSIRSPRERNDSDDLVRVVIHVLCSYLMPR